MEFAVKFKIQDASGTDKLSQDFTVVADLYAQQETLTGRGPSGSASQNFKEPTLKKWTTNSP